MSFYSSVLRPLLFRFDAETAHRIGMRAVKLGLMHPATPPELPVEAFGVRFRNPIGLAAGFDKNGECIDEWEKFGFGFIEVGTVTPRPQPGES